MDELMKAASGVTLDPDDWQQVRKQSHRMLDAMMNYIEHVRDRPVWKPIPDEVRARFRADLPTGETGLADVFGEFTESIMPFATGNVHPGFMGWVHGGGTVAGMLGEMLAAGLNSNLGGRDHIPIEVERQVVEWVRQWLGFPEGASGLFVTGTSIANFMGVIIAKTAALGLDARRAGIAAGGKKLIAYTSSAAHGCIAQGMELSGLGSAALRLIETDERGRMNVDALRAAIAADRQSGLTPFLIVGTAGTVDTGAIDNLAQLSALCQAEKIWFHVDGAIGALAVLAPDIAPRLRGIEKADSIAFDFHKWGQVPYDAGFLLVRDAKLHLAAFASSAAYLRRETRGLAAGSPWPCDFGPDLSRGFRALKTWFTLKVYGTDRLGAVISRTCAVARYLEARVKADPRLELLAPAQLNIVCFRYRAADADAVNAKIVVDLHESGIVAPSTTTIRNVLAIRAAIVNHRTQPSDIDALIDATIAFGDAAAAKRKAGYVLG
jgi:glutamate/tyrosine decarboxylase-like PLP-dependent enzyme